MSSYMLLDELFNNMLEEVRYINITLLLQQLNWQKNLFWVKWYCKLVIFMYNDKIYLTSQDILEKEFKIDTRGYRLQEVDKFLDLIIHDYVEFNNLIKKTSQEKRQAEDEVLRLKQEIRNMKMNIEVLKQSEKEITNVDLLRRISHLEKIIYGKDE